MAQLHMSQKETAPRNNRALWTISDLLFLEQFYRSRSLVEIAEHLGRSPGAVALMAHKLGCRSERGAVWAQTEMDIIRHHYRSGVGAEFLQQLLPGRSVSAIFSMAEKMGVLSGRFWREEELATLKAHYPQEGTLVTARLPGRNVVAVRVMARRLGLKKSSDSTSGFRPWSDEEWRLLKESMHLSVVEQQATLFTDRTLLAVEKARGRLIKKLQGITTIRLQNGTRSVSITPEQLYQNGRKGCVTLTVNTPDCTSGKQYFYLCMAPESGWLIRNERLETSNNSMMTEEVFFRAIEELA